MNDSSYNKSKQRIYAFDFIKAASALGIICFHFGCHAQNLNWLVSLPNYTGSWGSVLVAVFFLTSGALLYLHHNKIDSVWRFYKRRWIAIFPAFYLAYLFIFLESPILHNATIALRHPIKYYFFTFIGMDGYLFAWLQFHTFYILGEWFLGAIIIAYLTYPVLLGIINKSEFFSSMIIVTLFVATYTWNMFSQDPFRNVFSVIFSFYLGMLIMKHQIFLREWISIVSLVFLLLLLFIPAQRDSTISAQADGLLLFFVFYSIGSKITTNSILKKIIVWLSNISYEIFLLQHVVILYMLEIWNPKNVYYALGLLGLTIVRIVFAAFILHYVVKQIVFLVNTYITPRIYRRINLNK
ncbi:acyltransferase [Megasphaera sp. AM44-1BH]|uniref:acyltransferase family protein n=1 Tax=Megasphaera sp. AM44-1BH TaxID=2292358 RepID=UPI000E5550A5|nr:acyltransferase family protein [Megasphaera sp. AM44-1BH]RHA14250.1 acyltransferase [Megasphaera sp. AM44-1BH]